MEGQRAPRRFIISSHMVSELEKVAEDVNVLKEELRPREHRRLHLQSLCTDRPRLRCWSASSRPTLDLALIASRELGPTRKLSTCASAAWSKLSQQPNSLTSSPLFFQDAAHSSRRTD